MNEVGAAGAEAIAAACARVRAALAGAGLDTPDLDARFLVAEAAGCRLGAVHRAASGAMDAAMGRRLARMLERRLAGEPVHRILGRRPFFEHDFRLSPDTLEPRPETELLVTLAQPILAAAIARRGAARFVDIGTGTGAIAVSLLALCPQAVGVATDIAPGALATACDNARDAGVAERFRPVVAHYTEGLSGPFDLVVSNPPYIRTDALASLAPEVVRFDPARARDGGADGLDAYRAIAAGAAGLLAAEGRVLTEIGQGMAPDVEAVFAEAGFESAERAADLAGITRALTFVVR